MAFRRFGWAGLGLGVLGCLAPAGCGIGTEASLLSGPDAAARPVLDAGFSTGGDAGPPVADAALSSELPSGKPPLDRQAWQGSAIATFALG